MNFKLIIGGIIAVIVAVVIGIEIYSGATPEAPVGTYVDEDFVVTRPDVQAKPNTFNVMTPEEKAEAEAAQIAAEQAALNASSTATSTATSTDSNTDSEVVPDQEDEEATAD